MNKKTVITIILAIFISVILFGIGTIIANILFPSQSDSLTETGSVTKVETNVTPNNSNISIPKNNNIANDKDAHTNTMNNSNVGSSNNTTSNNSNNNNVNGSSIFDNLEPSENSYAIEKTEENFMNNDVMNEIISEMYEKNESNDSHYPGGFMGFTLWTD